MRTCVTVSSNYQVLTTFPNRFGTEGDLLVRLQYEYKFNKIVLYTYTLYIYIYN